ncbi:ATP-dependent helicase [Gulosibacter macacae]|uniref:DNA 3'-5' helicase n=1 Tax=Gulosibacter macacae TaxID=2488791 RepID=A0A3P3W0L9_9MICO|nr:PD-(D/E)XK nuclease family protein [Gulosibacter macacae]RRJ88602.1 ATP-dependent helicase [Gulosibacter macacae]
MSEQHAFSEPVVRLDAAQQAVVERAHAAKRDSFAVIGAPGSGKSTALVEFIAARVDAGAAPESILAIAANRQLAASLRNRLAGRLRVAMRGSTLGRTAPSVALEIVADERARNGESAPKLLTGSQQDAILADLLEGSIDPAGSIANRRASAEWPDWLDPETLRLRGFRDELRALLAAMAELEVSPEQLRDLAVPAGTEAPAGERHRALWAGAAVVAADYEDVLDAAYDGVFDTPTVLALAARMLGARDGLSRRALDEVELIVVDDAQELTEPARRLIRAFERRGVQVVTFGDPDLATGAFHGGRAEFATNWRDAGETEPERVMLGQVHRHGPEIRTAVAEASARIGVRGEGRQRAAQATADTSSASELPAAAMRVCGSVTDETELAIGYLRRLHLTEQVPWREMAVIARTGSRLPELARAFDRATVPTSSSTPLAAADDATVRAILELGDLAAATVLDAHSVDAAALQRILAAPLFGVDPLEFRRLRRGAFLAEAQLAEAQVAQGRPRDDDKPHARAGVRILVDTLVAEVEGHRDPVGSDVVDKLGASARPHAARAFRALVDTLRRMRARLAVADPIDTALYEAWRDQRRADEWQRIALAGGPGAAEMNRRLDALVVLFDRAKRFVEREPRGSLASFLEEWRRDSVVDDSLGARAAADAVTLTTPAGAVGGEWRVVVLVGVNEGAWPNLRVRDTLLGAGRLDEALRNETPRSIINRRQEVLDDESRMLVASLSRASRRLLVTAVADDTTQPSPYLRWLGLPELAKHFAVGDADALGYGQVTLPGLAAELRRTITARDASDDEEVVAALARLARSGVVGASPGHWFGIRGPSTVAPLVTPEQGALKLSLAPSGIKYFVECELNWFIESYAGGVASEAQAFGTLLHSVAEHGPGFDSLDAMLAFADAEFAQLQFDAPWIQDVQRRRIQVATRSLWEYLHGSGAEGVANEAKIAFSFDEPIRELGADDETIEADSDGVVDVTVEVRGRIDRIERVEGGLRIIDFKSGESTPSAKEVVDHGQLTAYQLAYQAGAFEPIGIDTSVEQLEGAALVYPEKPSGRGAAKKPYRVVLQPVHDDIELANQRRAFALIALGQAGVPVAGDEVEFSAPPSYSASIDTHCDHKKACYIHTISEVTE